MKHYGFSAASLQQQQQQPEMSIKPDEMVSYVVNKKQRFVLLSACLLAVC